MAQKVWEKLEMGQQTWIGIHVGGASTSWLRKEQALSLARELLAELEDQMPEVKAAAE